MNDLIQIGQITSPHGIRGRLRFHPMVEDVDALTTYKSFFDGSGNPLKIKFVKPFQKQILVEVNGINDRTQSEKMRGTNVFIRKDALPELSDDTFYFFELEGMQVRTLDDKPFGIVKTVANYGASDVLEIELVNGVKKDYAFISSVFPRVEKEKGVLYIVPPMEVEGKEDAS